MVPVVSSFSAIIFCLDVINCPKEELYKTIGELHLSDKLIRIATFNTNLNALLETEFQPFAIYRSKGLLTHLIN